MTIRFQKRLILCSDLVDHINRFPLALGSTIRIIAIAPIAALVASRAIALLQPVDAPTHELVFPPLLPLPRRYRVERILAER